MVSTINLYSFDQYSKNLRLLLLCCMFPAATETVVIAVAVLLCILIVTIGALAGFRFWIRRRRNYAEFTDDHDSRCKQLNDVHKSIMQFCHKIFGVELLCQHLPLCPLIYLKVVYLYVFLVRGRLPPRNHNLCLDFYDIE